MADLPLVLCGGFARSGTSFLCNLIETLGFSPGTQNKLKSGAPSNPRGYWEFLPIRQLTWRAVGVNKTLFQHRTATMPDIPLRLDNHPNVKRVRKLARKYRVEVYKDNYLPFVYTMFPASAKVVIIHRDWQDIYASTLRVTTKHKETAGEYRQAIEKFYKVARKMRNRHKFLSIRYEWFHDDFDSATAALAQFLEVREYSVKDTRAVWSPNKR